MTSTKLEINDKSESEIYEETSKYLIEDSFEYFNHFDVENVPKIIWKRPKQIVDDPCLLESYENEIDGYTICGSQTPFWFPALITLLKIKKLLYLVIKDIEKQDNFNKLQYNGTLIFSFFGKNYWTRIIIDDRLPFVNNEIKNLFCMSSNKEEFLAALLEKAYAKYLGGYGKLQNLDFIEALMHFTGGIVEQIEFRRELTPLTMQEQKSFFRKMKSYSEDVVVLFDTNTKIKNNLDSECNNYQFLIPDNHYYVMTGLTSLPVKYNSNVIDTVLSSIFDFHNHGSIDLLRLHNPVLHGDWNGPYSVGSIEWEGINDSIRRHYNLKFNHEFEFWITVDDLNKNMGTITLCHIPSVNYIGTIFNNKTMWYNFYQCNKYLSFISGGPLESLQNEFLRNHQYVIDVTYEGSVDLKIILSMNYIDNDVRYSEGCGIILFKVENNRFYRLHDIDNGELINLNILSSNVNSYSAFVSLIKGRYIILPWRPALSEVEYYFRIYTNQKAVSVSNLILEDRPQFLQCLKCNVIKTLIKTKDIITNLSLNNERAESYNKRDKCTSCVANNAESAIRMTVASAIGLERNYDKSPINSYFILKSTNYSFKSNTKVLTINPIWNESFLFYRTKSQLNDISIEVFSEQKLGFDKSLGMHIFSENDLSKEELVCNLKMPVKREWVVTDSKIIVRFKIYLPSSFDKI